MTDYRRLRVPGGTYFFTVKLRNPDSRLLVDQVEELRMAFRTVMTAHPFSLDAIVVMPNHLHALWTLPPGDSDYSTRWRQIKAAFSRGIPKGERRSAKAKASAASGSGASGSTSFGINAVSTTAFITSTTTPSSTAS